MKKHSIKRRGQSEVIGGIIVLTLLFMFAVPLLFQSYQAIIKAGQENIITLSQEKSHFNEKLSIGPVDPNDELAIRAGWIPGVWMNNTGSVSVTLDKLILVNELNHTIYRVYDLKYTRPGTSPEIAKMLLNVDINGYGEPPPPMGEPITLDPGEKLLVVFNTSILPIAPNLIVLAESSTGVIHPIAGGSKAPQLYPGRPKGTGLTGGWRGIYAPQSGFLLIGADEITKYSNIWGERPCYYYEYYGTSYSWAYDNDPDIPPYYRIEYDYDTIRGFLGTFDVSASDSSQIYIDGWYAGSVSSPCIRRYTGLGYLSKIMTTGDMDRNGVNELIFYTYWIHYYGGSDYNPDSDFDRNAWSDSISLDVQVARDISGVDFIQVNAKIIYDIAVYGSGEPSIPLKVFSIALWVYNKSTERWDLYSTKDFDFINNGPKTFVISATFPTNRSDTYRIGVIFYDPYKETYSGAYYEFMMGLEHLIVQYGVLNPYFLESPPLYLVAIPDPKLIGDIGEVDYANAHNISDLDLAKVLAQKSILDKIKGELEYAGIAGYTIINDTSTLCNLLFSDNPPKYAIIMWLQGNVTPSQVTRGACNIGYDDVSDYLSKYHWIWVSPFGEPLGDTNALIYFNRYVSIAGPGTYQGNITENGITVRKKMYAYYLFNHVPFNYTVTVPASSISYVIPNGTYYVTSNTSNAVDFGTTAIYNNEKTGVIVINGVHIDWDQTGDGAIPETVAQQVVYSALYSWVILRGS